MGFLLASLLITFAVRDVSFADYNTVVRPGLVQPITTLRTLAFTFSFLSIGLTTRFRDSPRPEASPSWLSPQASR